MQQITEQTAFDGYVLDVYEEVRTPVYKLLHALSSEPRAHNVGIVLSDSEKQTAVAALNQVLRDLKIHKRSNDIFDSSDILLDEDLIAKAAITYKGGVHAFLDAVAAKLPSEHPLNASRSKFNPDTQFGRLHLRSSELPRQLSAVVDALKMDFAKQRGEKTPEIDRLIESAGKEYEAIKNSFGYETPCVSVAKQESHFVALVGVASHNMASHLNRVGSAFRTDAILVVWADAERYGDDIEAFQAAVQKHAVQNGAVDPRQYRDLEGNIAFDNYQEPMQECVMGKPSQYPPYHNSTCSDATNQITIGEEKGVGVLKTKNPEVSSEVTAIVPLQKHKVVTPQVAPAHEEAASQKKSKTREEIFAEAQQAAQAGNFSEFLDACDKAFEFFNKPEARNDVNSDAYQTAMHYLEARSALTGQNMNAASRSA